MELGIDASILALIVDDLRLKHICSILVGFEEELSNASNSQTSGVK